MYDYCYKCIKRRNDSFSTFFIEAGCIDNLIYEYLLHAFDVMSITHGYVEHYVDCLYVNYPCMTVLTQTHWNEIPILSIKICPPWNKGCAENISIWPFMHIPKK